MPQDLSHLSERTLSQVLGGLLLSHYRSRHPSHPGLQLLREFRLHGNTTADFVIYDESRKQPVAVFEHVSSPKAMRDKLKRLDQLHAYLSGGPAEFVIVVPETA